MSTNNMPERAAAGTPVAHDSERFRLLFSNGRPVIPADYSAPLEFTTIRQLVGDRVRKANTPAEPALPVAPKAAAS